MMKAMTVADWMDRYYKPDRLNRDPDCRGRLIADRLRSLRERGFAGISHYDSVTGHAVTLFDPHSRAQLYIPWACEQDTGGDGAKNDF